MYIDSNELKDLIRNKQLTSEDLFLYLETLEKSESDEILEILDAADSKEKFNIHEI